MKVTIAIFAIIVFAGCNAVKQATKHTNKALRADSATVVKIVRKIAPCVTTYIDTTTEVEVVQQIDTMVWFDTIKVQCPDSAGVKIERQVLRKYYNIYKRDSVYITKTVIKTIEDQTYLIENRKLEAERKTYQRKIKNWQLNFFILLCVAILELVFIIYKIKSK